MKYANIYDTGSLYSLNNKSTRLFQICYKKEQLSNADPLCTVYDNTDNLRPDLREWWSWNKIHNSKLVEDVDYWGAVSFKFNEKTKIRAYDFLKFFKYNSGYEVYSICPSWLNGQFNNFNVWNDGDRYHPNLSQLANDILNKLGYDIDVRKLNMSVYFFCNFFIASKNFWNEYMKLIDSVFELCSRDSDLNTRLFKIGLSNYYQDPTAPMFPFFIERLTPTYILLKNYKWIPYKN